KIVPFYDRTQLIHETLGTLKNALTDETLVAIIVVIVMVNNLISSGLISLILPLAVLMTFMIMKVSGVEANLMALAGIAIAIGVMVDMGIILCENILRHIEHDPPGKSRFQVIHEAATEVGGAVITSTATTIVAFLPVFLLTGPEGKLFKPVAFTKTFAITASLVLALSVIPPLAHILFTKRNLRTKTLTIAYGAVIVAGIVTGFWLSWLIGIVVILMGAVKLVSLFLPPAIRAKAPTAMSVHTDGPLDASRTGKGTNQEYDLLGRYHFPAFGLQQAPHHLLPSRLGVVFGPQGYFSDHTDICGDSRGHRLARI
ncbi:MAG: efflux RND transporter permease subunit, partial [Deltaproteobacteria bacterium]